MIADRTPLVIFHNKLEYMADNNLPLIPDTENIINITVSDGYKTDMVNGDGYIGYLEVRYNWDITTSDIVTTKSDVYDPIVAVDWMTVEQTEFTIGNQTTQRVFAKYRFQVTANPDETERSADILFSYKYKGNILYKAVTISQFGAWDSTSLYGYDVIAQFSGGQVLGNADGILEIRIGNKQVITEFPDKISDITGSGTVRYKFTDEYKKHMTQAFSGCTGMVSVTLPTGMTQIGETMCYACNSLTGVTIPNTVTSIGRRAFFACTSLTDIIIPDSVVTIGDSAFDQNGYREGITNLYLGASVVSIGEKAFHAYPVKELVLPDSLKTIGKHAFAGNHELTIIYIGSQLQSIGAAAFDVSPKLNKIVSARKVAPTIEKTTFRDVGFWGTLVYPDDSTGYDAWLATTEYYLGAYGWNFNNGGYTLYTDLGDTFEEEKEYVFTVTHNVGATIIFDAPDEIEFGRLSTQSNIDGSETSTFTIFIQEEYMYSDAIIGITDNVWLLKRNITIITKEDEEDIMGDPTISFSSYNSLSLPQSGGNITFAVTYENTSEADVNTPYTPAYGVTLTPTGMDSGDTFYKVWYSLSAPATTYQLDIPVIFSCVGLNGTSCTEILTITQSGDTNKITVSPASSTYASSGEYRTNAIKLSVTDYDGNPNAITYSTYGYVSSNGQLITQKWFNVYEGDGNLYYDVKTNAITATDTLCGIVSFSYTASDGKIYNAQHVVIVEAADDEERKAFDPEVQPYVTRLRISGSGENDGQKDYYIIKVNYQDLQEGTINDPTVDVDWFHLSEGTMVESTVDGVLYEYTWSADENTSDARSTTVVFSAEYDGIAYTADVLVQQAMGVEGDEDDDDDEKPDIPSIEGVYIGPIWKDVYFDFGNNQTVEYTIYYGNNLIFKGKSWLRPNTYRNEILVNKLCQNYLSQTYLDLDSVSWEVNSRDFTLRSADGTQIYHTYRFINDWSYSDDFKTGLLSHPILNNQIGVRGQMFPFSLYGAGEQVKIEYGVEYMDGYTDKYGNPIEDWWSTEYITNGVSTDFFVVARRDAKYIDTVWIGHERYKLKESCEIPYVIYYNNPWGGFDWFPIRGKVTAKDRIIPYKTMGNYNNTKLDFGNSRYLTEISRSYNLNTGWLKQEEGDRMWYLLQSNVVYLHDLKADKIYPVVITDTEVEYKQKTRTEKIINYNFTVELSQMRERI